jgi:hypothetical protein
MAEIFGLGGISVGRKVRIILYVKNFLGSHSLRKSKLILSNLCGESVLHEPAV